MEIEITEEKVNPFFRRKEITGLVHHSGEATPTRDDVRAKLAAMINSDKDRVILVSLMSQFGQSRSQLRVHAYENVDHALQTEPTFLLKRNALTGEN